LKVLNIGVSYAFMLMLSCIEEEHDIRAFKFANMMFKEIKGKSQFTSDFLDIVVYSCYKFHNILLANNTCTSYQI